MRLFIGIPLNESVVAAIASFVAKTASPGDGLRWTDPESWHITLQFLGSTKPEQYDCVVQRLRELRADVFAIELGDFGAFERAGIFFISVVMSPALSSLQQQVTSATATCGFVAESRRYSPHITLARAKGYTVEPQLKSLKARTADQARALRFTATEFRLYESFTLPGGSRYEVRERFALAQ